MDVVRDRRGRPAGNAGKRTATDAAGLTLTYDYDALDRVTRVTYPDASYEQTTYKWLDAEKRRDRLGRWTTTFYDALRRPVATRDAKGGTTQYHYGAAGCESCSGGGDSLTKLVDGNGNATNWEYDVQGRVARETRANGAYEAYTYETATSRLKQKTDRRNLTTTFEYFLDGKLKRKSYSDTTPATSYTYDPVDGLILTAANGTDTLTWTYDNLDRVATEASTKNASIVGYTYDDAGNRASLSLDASTYLTYGYDPYGRLTSITRGANVFGFGYDTASRRASMSYPNGVVTTYGYDGESRLTSIVASKGSTPITNFTYTLDAAGNRTRKTTLDWAEDYGYDELYRLVSAGRSGASPTRWRWAYDAVGNRTADQTGDASNGSTYNNLNQLQSRAPGGALAFRGTTNEPATVTIAGQPAATTATNTFSGSAPVGSGNTDVAVTATDASGNTRTNTYRISESGATASYTYDSNGNLASKTEGTDNWTYEWNALNQLTRVTKNSIEQARFAYDPLGRRVERVAGGVTTSFSYDGADMLRQVRGGTTLAYTHGPGIDEPLDVRDGTGTSYLHADGLTSQVRATNETGTVNSTRQYDAWGNLESGGTSAGYAFAGREWDPEVGLYYVRARYYDPTTGRFIREDPIRQKNGNLYPYAADNPVGYIDPFGNEPVSIALAGIAGATAPAWVGPAAVAVTGAAAIAAAWGIGENLADALYPPPAVPPLPPSGGDATTAAPALPPTTALPPLPPIPPTTTIDPPAPPVCVRGEQKAWLPVQVLHRGANGAAGGKGQQPYGVRDDLCEQRVVWLVLSVGEMTMSAARKSTVVPVRMHDTYTRVARLFEAFDGAWSMASAGFVKSETIEVAGKGWIVSFRIDAYHVDRDLTTKPRLRASITLWPPRHPKARQTVAERQWVRDSEQDIRANGYEGEWRRSPWGRFGDFWKDLRDARAVAAEVARLDQLGASLLRKTE